MEESWKPVTGYEGWYEVSDLGRVRRIMPGRGVVVGNILSPIKHSAGYLDYQLSKDNKVSRHLGHRLVALAFIPNPESKRYINHKDGVKTNNVVANLEWVTAAENNAHSQDVLGNYKTLSREDVIAIRKAYYDENVRQVDLAKRYNVTQNQISMVVLGKSWVNTDGQTSASFEYVTQSTPESFRPIPGFPDYLVSNYGKFRSLRSGNVLTGTLDPSGQVSVGVSNANGKKVLKAARVVAEVFLGPANGRLVRHRNGNNSDNRVNNLEYVEHIGCISRSNRKDKGSKRT